MNALGPLLYAVLSNLFGQVPMIVVSLLGVIVSGTRWRDAPAASRWTLAASLLSLGVCLGGAVSQAWMMTAYASTSNFVARSWLFGGLSLLWTTLRAVATGLLLAGVYAGRESAGAGLLPPPVGDYPLAPGR